MAAVTIAHPPQARLTLGLGVSGPQVVEGWYGRPSNKPLARTREYVEIIRAALRREQASTRSSLELHVRPGIEMILALNRKHRA